MITSTKIKLISWLTSLVVINNIIIFTPKVNILYYTLLTAILIYSLIKGGLKKCDYSIIFLYICCLFSILANNIPQFFKPWDRFISFIIVTSLISPFIKSSFLIDYRIKTFLTIQKLLEIIIMLSTIAYFGSFGYKTGFFAGITSHSMLLAPVSANVIINSIYKLLYTKYTSKNITLYYLIILCCSFICLLLAASRTAIIGVILSILLLLYITFKDNISKLIKYLIYIIVIMTITLPLWSQYLDIVISKNEGSMAAGGLSSSRDEHWENRINEFKSSPIFGIGFASISTTSTSGSIFDSTSGKVETGSSWLCALSMTGIFGFLALALIFINSYIKAYKIRKINLKLSALLTANLVFWSIHMIAEGYIFAAGSFLFFNVWLLLGLIDSLYNKIQK